MNNTNAERLMKIRTEVMDAYADSHMKDPDRDWEVASKIRNLNFLASGFVNRREAKEILKEAIVNGYNEFTYELLDRFPEDSMFLIAREGSVCLYVAGGNLPSAQRVNASERDIYPKQDTNKKEIITVRFWWD